MILQTRVQNVQDSEYSGCYVNIASGGTVCCYRHKIDDNNTTRKSYILLKEFRPLYGKSRFSLLHNVSFQNASAKRIVEDFLRFLKQNDEIGRIISALYKIGINSFSAPKLYLTSLGLAYLDTAFCGSTLTETIETSFEEFPQDFDDIIARLEVVKQIAKLVEAYYDANCFNGDLKPDNLYQIANKSEPIAVVNIDYDTCVKLNDIGNNDKQVFDNIRTTRAFYCVTGMQNLKDCEGIEQAKKYLLKFDVAAISNILIYILLSETRRKKLLESLNGRITWYNSGFKSKDGGECVSTKLYELLGCQNSLVRRAIYNEISTLLKMTLCATNQDRYNIEQFLEQLEIILAMLKCCDKGVAVVQEDIFKNYLKKQDKNLLNQYKKLSAKILWFANLHQLDKTFGNQLNKIIGSHNENDKIKVDDTDVKQIINKLVYGN